MTNQLRRREFLQTSAALGLGAAAGLRSITPASADDMVVGPDAVRFRPEIEPVVRWIEETPREQVFDVAVDQLKAGLSYRDLFAGLFLAGIRNVKPRPVGFKFHAVLVMNSAHLLGQTAAVEDRLLPMFWALDNFKSAQAQDVREGDWTLGRVDEARLPSAAQARAEFCKAMDAWDADAADTATAALCRNAGANETIEAFWRYAVRDQRNIGHKAIFAMQCWRTLQAIGWQHAEPVLRSLAFGMLDLQGDSTRQPVGPYEANLRRAATIRDAWTAGKPDAGATRALLETLRQADPDGASEAVVQALNAGVAPGSLWDAVILDGSEMLLRNPGIIPLHAVTSANALHFIGTNSADDTTRKMALLQAAGWMPLFRRRIENPAPLKLDAIEPAQVETSGDEALRSIFATVAKDRQRAAAQAIGYLQGGGSPDDLFRMARRLIFRKANDSHQYKYGAAAWEEYHLATDPKWSGPIAAAALAYFPSSEADDSPLMKRAAAAVERVRA
jgi:hypothetical protein